MGLVYLPTWMVDVYGFHVGKYTIYMDASWVHHRPHQAFLCSKVPRQRVASLRLIPRRTSKEIFVAGAANQASAWTQRGEQKSSDFFFQTHRPTQKHGGFLAMMIWFVAPLEFGFMLLKGVLQTQPNQQDGWLFSNCSWKGIFFVAVFWGAKFKGGGMVSF